MCHKLCAGTTSKRHVPFVPGRAPLPRAAPGRQRNSRAEAPRPPRGCDIIMRHGHQDTNRHTTLRG